MTAVAALPMYDLPEIRSATDAWWRSIARALRREGVQDVPDTLDRSRAPGVLWRDPGLLLTQTCGYPLTHDHADALTALAVPSYAAEGCALGRYRSAFVIREPDPATTLADLRGRRVAANEPGSQSGCNALRAAVAPLATGGRFFSTVIWTGAHRASLAAVRAGKADVASVDAVTLALLRRYASRETDGLRILGWSEEAPALPYATRRSTRNEVRKRLLAGVVRAAEDPDAADARATLLIEALSAVADVDYAAIPAMRSAAERIGYPKLA